MPDIIEFLRKQKETVQSPEMAKKQKLWLEAVHGLLKEIRAWLAEAEGQNLIKVEEGQTSITEETTGTYKAPMLTLSVPSTAKEVKVVPIGRTIIGADGRVDVKSLKGTYILLYLADRHLWVHGRKGGRPEEFPIVDKDLFTDLLTRSLA